jgi:hypothetical protein
MREEIRSILTDFVESSLTQLFESRRSPVKAAKELAEISKSANAVKLPLILEVMQEKLEGAARKGEVSMRFTNYDPEIRSALIPILRGLGYTAHVEDDALFVSW